MTNSNTRKSRLSKLAKRSPLIAGAVVFGVAGTGEADADLVIQNINQTLGAGSVLNFDLDQNGADDFRIEDKGSSSFIQALSKNGRIFETDPYVISFSFGDTIDGSVGTPDTFSTIYNDSLGPFGTVGATGFVGLSLVGGGNNIHYGWLEITRGSTIVGQAGYQTTPGGAAVAGVPEPSSLGLIAAGAAGLAALRRRRRNNVM